MIGVTDLLLLSFYTITFVVAAYISINRAGYFIHRLRKGDISLFVFGALIFVNAYALSMIAAFSSRLRLALEMTDHAGAVVTTYLWTLGQIGCMLGIAIISYNVFTNHYDLAIVTGRRRRELEYDTSGITAQVIGTNSVAEPGSEVRNGKVD